jgi:hypothetical protein
MAAAPYRLHLKFHKTDGSHHVAESFLLYVHVTPGVRQKGAQLIPQLDVAVKANVQVLEDGSLSTDFTPFDPPIFTAKRKVVNLHAFMVLMPKASKHKMCKLTVTAKYTGAAPNHPEPAEADALICWNGEPTPPFMGMMAPKAGPIPTVDSPPSGTFAVPYQVTLGANNSLIAYGMVDPCSTFVGASLTTYNPAGGGGGGPGGGGGGPGGGTTVILMFPDPLDQPSNECWCCKASGLPLGQAYKLVAQAFGGGTSPIVYITT